MAELVGEDNLSENEQELLHFAGRFEAELLNQSGQARTLKESLAIAFELLVGLDPGLLDRVTPEMIELHLSEELR
jgi:vacuolar-type H+-ATPase subunit B/Vma2